MKTKLYKVKLKISIPGFRNLFFNGIAKAKNPQIAKDISIDCTVEGVLKSPTAPKGIVIRDYITVVQCEIFRCDFTVNQETYKKGEVHQ